MPKLENKKIAIVISFRNFQDQEFFIPKNLLEKEGAQIRVVSNKLGQALGIEGGEIEVDSLREDINMEDFDALVFVGGGGCLPSLDNEISYKLIKEAQKEKKLIAAICISPLILAKAGILKNKKATVWNSPMDQFPVRKLKENGADFQSSSVVQDGNIITARGPEVAEPFGEKIIKLLK